MTRFERCYRHNCTIDLYAGIAIAILPNMQPTTIQFSSIAAKQIVKGSDISFTSLAKPATKPNDAIQALATIVFASIAK